MSTTEKVEMSFDKISETTDVNESYQPRRGRSKLRVRSRSRSEASSSPRNRRLKSYVVQCRNRSRSRDRLSGSRLRSRSPPRDMPRFRDQSPDSCVAQCCDSCRSRGKIRRGRSRSKSQSRSPSWDPFGSWSYHSRSYVIRKRHRSRSRSRSTAQWSQSPLSSRSFQQESNFVQSRTRSKPATSSSMNEQYLENFSQMCSISEQNRIVRGLDGFSCLNGQIEREFKSENQRKSSHSHYTNRNNHRAGERSRRTLNYVRIFL
ncbi:uncharacterized protein [Bemisia tabaci]|uniref:uncharacterized protein isoform X2 n=1 Tax=Bemisia tabaci TaxID=7038 RepID=UPI003B28A401